MKYYFDKYGELRCSSCKKELNNTDCYEYMYCCNKDCKEFDKNILIAEHIGKEGII